MQRKYSFDDFYKNTMREICADGEKELIRVFNRLAKQLPKETKRVFKFIEEEAIGSSQNPFSDVNNLVWRPLNKKYAKRKGNNLFWEHRTKLGAWLFNTNPNRVFGSPKVQMENMRVKSDSVKATINIDFYPRHEFNIKGIMYNRLFAKTKKRLGSLDTPVSFISNEELRPIMKPGMEAYIKRYLNRKVNLIIKEVLK